MARPELSPTEIKRFRQSAAGAALDLVEEHGVPSLTVRRLADRLGCSYAKPYSYFRDKAHLIDAVRGLGFERLAEHVVAATEAETFGVDTYLRFALDHPEVYRVMFELRQDFVSPETRTAQARAWRVCTQPFRDAHATGALDGDPELIAHLFWAAMHGLASLELAGQLHQGKSVEDIARAMPFLAQGFRAESQNRTPERHETDLETP